MMSNCLGLDRVLGRKEYEVSGASGTAKVMYLHAFFSSFRVRSFWLSSVVLVENWNNCCFEHWTLTVNIIIWQLFFLVSCTGSFIYRIWLSTLFVSNVYSLISRVYVIVRFCRVFVHWCLRYGPSVCMCNVTR